jgi:hypothetical protein
MIPGNSLRCFLAAPGTSVEPVSIAHSAGSLLWPCPFARFHRPTISVLRATITINGAHCRSL